jgi:LysM repeat protein
MRKISLWLFIFAFTSGIARAQDSATQDQIDQINGKIQDLVDAQATQGKRIDALEKEISDLQDKSNQPGGAANPDDLKKLAEQVQEIDKKRQDDNEQILKALEKLDKAMGVSPPSHNSPTSIADTTTNSAAGGTQNGFYYEIQAGNTISAIAKAYTEKGHKVTVKQILDANPGLNPKNLIVGKKIFIPDLSAK